MMKKMMMIVFSAALMAMAVGCSKNKPAQTTPENTAAPAGGDAYGGAAAPEGTPPAEGTTPPAGEGTPPTK
jgi:hypothetical protein